MAAMDNFLRNAAIAAVLGGAVALSGCGSDGVGLEVDAPILNAVGLNLSTKKKDDDDLPERAGLVVPPSTEALPQPGSQTSASAAQNWPDDPDKRRKREAAEKTAAEEQYCREGRWDSKASISEFNKNVGVEQRCQSQLGKALSKSFGGGPATN
jgi:hypothetical protein